ncbi:MAG TPA: type II secretion system protein M [Burkholderiales bacterium]|jgi:type II secretory pathway component PulM|nr:type II secretion system protein M [Burkholderiales bacterium]
MMRARLRSFWESRSPRERAVAAVLAVVVGAVLYSWLLLSADRARSRLDTAVTALRAQAARLEQHAAEYERLRARPPATVSTTDLRALVEAQAGAAGLSRALARIDAPDAGQVQVVLGAVAFTDWLDWVAALRSQQVRLAACRIEALSTPGMVSVTATLVRAKPQ